MNRKLILTILVLGMAIAKCWSQDLKYGSKSAWIEDVSVETAGTPEDHEGYHYYLFDRQFSPAHEEKFYHFTYQVLNSDGVQSLSDISLSFDPSYQELTVHYVDVYRDGQKVYQIKSGDFSIFQQESNRERSLYDGSLSAVLELPDVRAGDVVDYAYTVKGLNPLLKNHIAIKWTCQYTDPVSKIYARMLVPKSEKYAITYTQEEITPKVQTNREFLIYTWELDDVVASDYDRNVPYWYDGENTIEITNIESWGELVEWALPVYEYTDGNISNMANEISQAEDRDRRILDFIRFVQDEVRYLGFESGIGAYKPNPPQKVYKQRYGDCKDKSLLLVALLREMDVDAYPVLVNSSIRNNIDSVFVTPYAFDHCVVGFELDNDFIIIDPTHSNQGGDLAHIYSPTYGKGLVIRPGDRDLTSFDRRNLGKVRVEEVIDVDEVGGSASIELTTIYSGRHADQMRSQVSSNTKEDLQDEYLHFYANLYPSIEVSDPVDFIDGKRDGENVFTIVESYTCSDIWELLDDSVGLYLEVYPILLESYLSFPSSPTRTMPYDVSTVLDYEQVTRVNLPEPWTIENDPTLIEREGMKYTSHQELYGNTLKVFHEFSIDLDWLEPEEAAGFLADVEDIRESMNFALYNYFLAEDAGVSSWMVVLAILFLGLFIFGAVKVYKYYDPFVVYSQELKPLGGWMVLPMIGMHLTPILLLYHLITFGFFDQAMWQNLDFLSDSFSLKFLIAAEFAYNMGLLVLAVLIVVLFYKRRSSFPRMITLFYIVNLVGQGLDTWIVVAFYPELYTDAETAALYKDVAKAVFAAIIWIPYFNLSTRVKETFIVQYSPKLDVRADESTLANHVIDAAISEPITGEQNHLGL